MFSSDEGFRSRTNVVGSGVFWFSSWICMEEIDCWCGPAYQRVLVQLQEPNFNHVCASLLQDFCAINQAPCQQDCSIEAHIFERCFFRILLFARVWSSRSAELHTMEKLPSMTCLISAFASFSCQSGRQEKHRQDLSSIHRWNLGAWCRERLKPVDSGRGLAECEGISNSIMNDSSKKQAIDTTKHMIEPNDQQMKNLKTDE